MRVTLILIALGLCSCLSRLFSGSDAAEPLAAGTQPGDDASIAKPAGLLPDNPTENDYPHLHNLIKITDRIYSGSEPEGEAAFADLAKLGVKTIVSVDGARPKIELAAKHGLRYVQIPIGYDGVSGAEGRSLASVAKKIEGPLYVHCHHGKHRGPAAAAIVCIADGKADGKSALAILERAGTSQSYAGLWRDVLGYAPPATDEELPELVSVADVGSLAAAMARIDRASDNLKLCEAAAWQSPAEHPDISPAQEALLMKEGFHETVRQLKDDNPYDDQFLAWMIQAEEGASHLESALKTGDQAGIKVIFAAVQGQCANCHQEYRN